MCLCVWAQHLAGSGQVGQGFESTPQRWTPLALCHCAEAVWGGVQTKSGGAPRLLSTYDNSSVVSGHALRRE